MKHRYQVFKILVTLTCSQGWESVLMVRDNLGLQIWHLGTLRGATCWGSGHVKKPCRKTVFFLQIHLQIQVDVFPPKSSGYLSLQTNRSLAWGGHSQAQECLLEVGHWVKSLPCQSLFSCLPGWPLSAYSKHTVGTQKLAKWMNEKHSGVMYLTKALSSTSHQMVHPLNDAPPTAIMANSNESATFLLPVNWLHLDNILSLNDLSSTKFLICLVALLGKAPPIN